MRLTLEQMEPASGQLLGLRRFNLTKNAQKTLSFYKNVVSYRTCIKNKVKSWSFNIQ